jgi:hypothetical protein
MFIKLCHSELVEESTSNLKLDPSTSPSTHFVRSGFAQDDKTYFSLNLLYHEFQTCQK